MLKIKTPWHLFFVSLCITVFFICHACTKEDPIGNTSRGKKTIVFKHGKLSGSPEILQGLLRAFEKQNPDIRVKDESLPAATDEQHQFYAINLEGGSKDFDVISMDVIWVHEFAKAGWLRDITHLLPSKERKNFFDGPIEAVTFNNRIYGIPWYIDAGVLYYRKDLLDKYGFAPPATWDDLIKIAAFITEKEEGLYGFIWQGKQYEGLVCNALEYFWGNGGRVIQKNKVVINSNENVEALRFMRELIIKHKITPEFVTSATEEPARHIFGNGKAVFMRNWPYAWNLYQKEGSPVKDRVGVTRLVSFPGKESASTLGGWQLGININSNHAEEAERFIRFFTSKDVQKKISIHLGYKPTRKSLYQDSDMKREQPFITSLYNIFLHARPRPVTPYYMMITQIMQPEFSAAISGIKSPESSLKAAQKLIEHILEIEE